MRYLVILLSCWLLGSGPVWAEKRRCTCKPCACDQSKGESTLEGRIAPAGPSIYMEGSHELHDASGKAIARISGLKAELDLHRYEGQWVKVSGNWRPTVEAGGKILEVTSLEAEAASKP